MATRDSGTSIVPGLGLGASLLLVLGLFIHRASQSSTSQNVESADRSTTTDHARGASNASAPEATRRLIGDAITHFPPDYLTPIARFLGKSIDELCQSGPLPHEHTPIEDNESRYWVERWEIGRAHV